MPPGALAGHARSLTARSGLAAAPAVALPVRVLNAPFARAARRRTGGVLDALLSGRGWIALVFVLLAGIVFFNVDLLQMNRDIARNAEKISTLKREIARHRLDVARLASSERIQESAAALGLVLPAPGEVRYLNARPTLDSQKRRQAHNSSEPGLRAPAARGHRAHASRYRPAGDGSGRHRARRRPTPRPRTRAYTDPAATDPAYADPAATDPATTAPAG